MSDFISSVVSGIVGGIVVWVIGLMYSFIKDRRDNRNKRIIKGHFDKIINDSIFWDLRPGTSLDMMKEMLGSPQKYLTESDFIFSEEPINHVAYFYSFTNAHLKIVSKDKVSISSIVIMPFSDKLSVDISPTIEGGITEVVLNKTKVSQKLLEQITDFTGVFTIKERHFALNAYVHHPIYTHFVFFGEARNTDVNNVQVTDFLNDLITGVCISSALDSVTFIHHYETI